MSKIERFYNLAAGRKASPKPQAYEPRYPAQIAPKSQAISRRDVNDWQKARRIAGNVDRPRRAALISIYEEIILDAHLTSQVDGRIERSLGAPFILCSESGETHEEATKRLSSSPGFARLMRIILETTLWGHSLVEIFPQVLGSGAMDFGIALIPRQNVAPELGLMLFDEGGDAGIYYRTAPEYGRSLLEFGEVGDLGLLCKAVPLALYKRFAISCWSELAEIYGIPPRYIRTDTSNPEMVGRAEAMMRDLGAAAWWIIDSTEEFNFAKGADTNGDVYRNLITLCNNEMSLLLSGAVVGQDTVNGNRSKEEVGIDLLDRKVAADRRRLEDAFNSSVLPALAALGIIPPGLRFAFAAEEDDAELWQRTVQALPYYNVDVDWVRNRFGIEVTDARTAQPAQLSAGRQVSRLATLATSAAPFWERE